jgi:hypothetical protein
MNKIISSTKIILIAGCLGLPLSIFGQTELEHIKNLLAEEALSGDVTVVTNAYINGDGKLIESTFYKGSTSVKGIRIANYFKNIEKKRYNFQKRMFEDNAGCVQYDENKYKYDVVVQVNSESTLPQPLLGFSNYIIEKIYNDLESIDTNWEKYNVRSKSIIKNASLSSPIHNSYQKYLLPRSKSIDDSYQYKITFSIIGINVINEKTKKILMQGYQKALVAGKYISRELSIANRIPEYEEPDKNYGVVISVSLENLKSESLAKNIPLSENIELIYLADKNEFIEKRSPLNKIKNILDWSESAGDSRNLSSVLHRYVESLLGKASCSLQYYLVENEGDYKLNIGSEHGVRIGDRFILSPYEFSGYKSGVTSTMLENISIAAVSNINNNESELQIIEGSDINSPSLYALPF